MLTEVYESVHCLLNSSMALGSDLSAIRSEKTLVIGKRGKRGREEKRREAEVQRMEREGEAEGSV